MVEAPEPQHSADELQRDESQRSAGPQCSAKGCRASASWALRWNNPKLHTPDYRKTWLACNDHRASLGGFLQLRGFLREVAPFPLTSLPPASDHDLLGSDT